jgi:endonuclease/exonuclease/phosphatase family metal-dependent hydrolase
VRNAKGMDDVVDFDRTSKVINNMDVDAVAIQELDSATQRSNGLIVLDELAKRTNMFASFNASIEFSGGKYGNGMLTKEKPLKVEAIALPGREEMRSMLVVELQDYVVCCTHLSLNEEDRQASIKLIQQFTEKYTTKPVFLAGDFNALPHSEEIKGLSNNWILLSDSSQATFPSDIPTQVIDYIFMKSNGKFNHIIKSAEVVNEPMASDHRPLWVEVNVD